MKAVYWFKRKYRQLKRVIEILPLVWNAYDFDYRYALELFKFQLSKTADYLESNKAYTVDAKTHAQKIRTAIRLMDKVYNEEYGMEGIDILYEKYGKEVLEADFVDTGNGDGTKYMKFKYESWDNADEIYKERKQIFDECYKKQERAHSLLWRYIEHNIQNWWT